MWLGCRLFTQGPGRIRCDCPDPKEWIADAAGVSGYNVMFNRGIETGRNQQVFVLFSTSDLPLDQSDRIGNCSEGGCIPLINPDEIQGKAFQVIKDKPIFKVITRGNGVWTVRYFFKSISYRLFMVEFSTPIADIHSKDYYSLINNVEDMISSMVFIEPK